ncbi:MAG TPA: hypothetical protein VE570_08320 [Thermoleophilaceae bacterium]|jgi:hypothetical protein|nr:hypothetical protein [Thermoleophilaceae bacterium]
MAVQPGIDTSAGHRYDVAPTRYGDTSGDGWLSFSIVLLAMAGCLNVIGGIAAIDNANFYVGNAEFVIGNLNTWGWIALCIGVVQLVTAYGIYRRNQVARWLGVFALAANAIGELLWIPAYPFWSLAIFALDLIAIYGLIVYGQKQTPARA